MAAGSFVIIKSIVNSLNVGIIAHECLHSCVEEASIPDIYKDYVVTQTDTHRLTTNYNPPPTLSG